jgi:hypothetical protein
VREISCIPMPFTAWQLRSSFDKADGTNLMQIIRKSCGAAIADSGGGRIADYGPIAGAGIIAALPPRII